VTGGELERLALGCLLPGFPGHEPPEWVRRLLEAGLGGVVLYAWNVGDVDQLRALTDALRAERSELVIAIDEEGGDVTRLEAREGSSYPGNWALGVVDDVELTRAVASAMAADLAQAGINLDLAPVVDVNTTADNPIIGVRSFGSDAQRVARHVAAFIEGLEAGGIAACAKHFPGHGDTLEDSHLELPTVDTVSEEALLPFRSAIDAGVTAIMTAHIRVQDAGDEPATLSRPLLTGLLRDELGFTGLAITDALEMKAISATVGVERGAVLALAAGADALCLGHDLGADSVDRIVRAVVEAVQGGMLAEERLAEAASRVAASIGTTTVDGAADRGVGAEAAKRALRSEGEVQLTRPAVVVELRPDPTIAVDARNGGLGEALAVRRADTRITHSPGTDTVDGQLVVVLQDAHRHEWQRDTAKKLVDSTVDTIVVEVGLPGWRPEGAAGYIATHGAARVNVEAAVDRLLGAI
jgi:beta-N-acetylhexosaminidase